MSETFTAFAGQRRLASGPLAEVALAVKRAEPRAAEPIAIFSDSTGRAVDLDLRGSPDEVLARLPDAAGASPRLDTAPTEPRGRGRPRLGVVAREVTLLPRHWEWLNAAARRRVGGVAQAGGRCPPRLRRPGSPARGARRRLSFHVGDGRQPAAFRGSLARACSPTTGAASPARSRPGQPTYATMSSSSPIGDHAG